MRVLRILGWMFFLSLFASCSRGESPLPNISIDFSGDNAFGGEDDSDDSDDDDSDVSHPDSPPALNELAPDKVLTAYDLDGEVHIVRDILGVPHIYAKTEHDLAFVTGYLMASDRYFEMEMMRRLAQGRLSELTGAENLSDDTELRLWGLGNVADKICAELETNDPRIKNLLDSFADGVNWFVQAQRKSTDIAVELVVLGISRGSQVEPWKCRDSASIARLHSWSLSTPPEEDITLMERLDKVRAAFPSGDPRFGVEEDIFGMHPTKNTAIIQPDGNRPSGPGKLLGADSQPADGKMLERASRLIMKTREMKGDLLRPDAAHGSNNWVVSPSIAENGYAMFANDTHLPLINPPIFYIVHFNTAWSGGSLNVAGFSFPGVPGVAIGQSEKAAWGATINVADVVDYYIEKVTTGDDGYPKSVVFRNSEVEVERRSETFKFKYEGKESCEELVDTNINDEVKAVHPYFVSTEGEYCILTVEYLTVPHHGPIISVSEDGASAISLRWTGFEPSNEFKAFLGAAESETVDELVEAFTNFKVGAQNIVFANVHGDIAYYAHASVPVRETYSYDNPPWLPMPGEGAYEWVGYLTPDEVPKAVNPSAGFIVTANNDPVGNTFDGDGLNEVLEGLSPFYSAMYDCGYRADRITSRILEKVGEGGLSLDDMKEIQGDVTSNIAEDFLPLFLEVLEEARAGTNKKTAGMFTPQMEEALEYLKDWSLRAASGVGENVTELEISDSVAASIFNAWFGFFSVFTLGDELRKAGTGAIDQETIRALVRFTLREELLVTGRGSDGYSLIFDNVETEVEETRDEIIIMALASGLDFLASGGFGTADMREWRWGKLHTLTLEHLGGAGVFSIPSSTDKEYPNGFPRPGDNFAVDSSDHGLGERSFDGDFSYSSGPAMRTVCELIPDRIHCETALPGGQISKLGNKHWDDLMRNYWQKNEYFKLNFYDDEIISAKEEYILFVNE
ncbi:MAG: penicillin acylase family protein [Myxococcota bacterium]